MTPADNLPLDATEHRVFWMLVKKAARRDDVARAYLAIQAALALGQTTVDVGWLTAAMMPDGQPAAASTGEAIGATGLAYFHWLYEIELLASGEADRHEYLLTRRSDGTRTVAALRTARFPRSLQFQQGYERQRRKLQAKREILLASFLKKRLSVTLQEAGG